MGWVEGKQNLGQAEGRPLSFLGKKEGEGGGRQWGNQWRTGREEDTQ